MTAAIRSMPELVEVIRNRTLELGLSYATVDDIAGLSDRYTAKLLGPIQLRGFSHMSLGAVLGALALKLIAVEDTEQRARVEGRWERRKRPQRLLGQAHRSSTDSIIQEMPDLSARTKLLEHLKLIARSGGKKGGKRRAKILGKRACRRIAQDAARMRWAKLQDNSAPVSVDLV